MPEVDDDSLAGYHRYFAARLTFPFAATIEDIDDAFQVHRRPLVVTELLDPDEADDNGLLCQVLDDDLLVAPLIGIEPRSSGVNKQLIGDYRYWFWNNQSPLEIEPHSILARPLLQLRLLFLLVAGVLGGIYGVYLGAVTAALDGALVAATVGAGLGGLFALAASFLSPGPTDRARQPVSPWAVAATLSGVAAALGGILGPMVVAYRGALAGGLTAAALMAVWSRTRGKPRHPIFVAGLTAALGVVAEAWLASPEDAFAGTIHGAVAEAIIPVGVLLTIAVLSACASRWRRL